MVDAAQAPSTSAIDVDTQASTVGTEDRRASTPAPPAAVTVTYAEKAGKGKGLRALRDRIALRRSFSTKQASLSAPDLVAPLDEPRTNDQKDGVSPVSPKRTKSSAFGRLINNKLGAKKGGKKTKDSALSADDTPTPVTLDAAPSDSFASSQPDGEPALPVISETEGVVSDTSVDTTPVANADPEPLSLARKIHSLLSALPPFLSTCDAPSGSDGQTNRDGKDTGAAPDAPGTNPDSDTRVISLLMSPSFMNGSLSRGRQSVWAMLDNIRLKSLYTNGETGAIMSADDGTPPVESLVEDNDSVMFYAPLLPDENSSVDIARSEIVSVDESGTILNVLLDNAPPRWGSSADFSATASSHAETFKWRWPWQSDPSPAPAPKPKTIEKRVWVPSTTQLSLQVMWWGYRLWLPPPVLAQLNDKEIEAGKVAAVVTAALQWLLNNVPQTALPPALQPALLLVKSLVPYIGYIGGFIAWSWGAIKGFDVGNGVTLTATWLLPIALVPGTWANEDVPQPPAAPSDPSAPAPSNPSPSPPPPAPSNPSLPNPTTRNPSVPNGGSPTTSI